MADLPIILYHYTYSPYARRVAWYFALRGIPYAQCLQPPMMPRPDLALLGINHRRIPVLAIGRDVYLDTRLMLSKLEAAPPSSLSSAGATVLPALGPTPASSGGNGSGGCLDRVALQRLLECLTIDAGAFLSAAALLPTSLPLLSGPTAAAYYKDRAQYFPGGGAMRSPDTLRRARPAALVEVARAFDLLESTLLADGREWILGAGEGPTLADIDAAWPFHWVTGIPGALADVEGEEGEGKTVSATKFPRVYAYVARFQKAVSAAKRRPGAPKTENVDGAEAARRVLDAPWFEPEELAVDAADPVARALGLSRGSVVEIVPTDTGRSHRDRGKLVGLDGREVVIEVMPQQGGKSIRLHAPRHGFRILKPREEGDTGRAKI